MLRLIGVNPGPVELMTQRAYGLATSAVNSSAERLATGKKINRASDDPAGSVQISQLKAQELEIKAKLKRLDRDEQWLGAREGQASVLADMVQELKSLTLQAANSAGLGEGERAALQGQVEATLDGIEYIGRTARFLGEALFQGFSITSLGGKDEYSLADLRQGGKLNLFDGDVAKADEVVDAVISQQAKERGGYAVAAKRIDSERSTLLNELTSVTDQRSKIEDTDYYAETSTFVRSQVLQQAALYMTQFARDIQAKTVELLLGGLKKP